ncbi:IS4 family transposase [Nocardia pseudovaccinii]|uniref:IS4 family transposase n=1 Tax=Nocardia pseudovaccinii TaxID=189540 RepID=UPI003D8FDEB7
MEQSVINKQVVVAGGRFAPGHLGELTRIVPFEMVDAALESGRAVQTRLRELPSRVVVYLLLAGCLFPDVGYRGVWAKLCSGLVGLPVAAPGSSALAQARRRVGVAPLRELFGLLAGPGDGAERWRGLLVCAIDGTSMFVADTDANLGVYHRQSGGNGDSGYPMLRLLTVVACGARTVIDAVFGTYGIGELAYASTLFGCLREGMLLLADRNFGYAEPVSAIAATKADLLIRCRNNLALPAIGPLPDGSWLTPMGSVVVRVIDAEITVTPKGGPRRIERYRLVTTLSDHRRFPATELVQLYHQRWQIETSYLELKSTILGGRVLRARTPAGITQEVYALLCTYQALRIAIADATATDPHATPLRASFTIALNTARDQLVHAAAVITDGAIDLVGDIGRAILDDLLPTRRPRQSPRVVKRAISKHRAKGTIDRTNYPRIDITINQRKPPT